jgi:hypothetical protein
MNDDQRTMGWAWSMAIAAAGLFAMAMSIIATAEGFQ